jgi:enoyl-[acyl-carrier-protein] reductase (NADH)
LISKIDTRILKLIKNILTSKAVNYLYLIGSYRDNEVPESHPLSFIIREIRKTGFAIKRITVPPLSDQAIKQMITQGSGSLVHVASMAGVTGLYDGHTYTAAKGAIVNLSRSLGITYIKQGIRSNVVAPGFVDTPMVEAVTPLFADPAVAGVLAPIARPADPSEIAAANAFFASDDSSYCNGSMLVVDGGCTARSFAG